MAVMHLLLLKHLGALNDYSRESGKVREGDSTEEHVNEIDLKEKRNGVGSDREAGGRERGGVG